MAQKAYPRSTSAKRRKASTGRSKTPARKRSKAPAKQPGTRRKATSKSAKKWSGAVTEHSDALDLQHSIFKSASALRIARSLKASADASHRRKGTPYQSAMSMLNFYINRGGSNLSAARRKVLQHAKVELRKVFHRD